MLAALIGVTILLLIQSAYFLYYKSQIKSIGHQLTFISEQHSYKFIESQIKPREIYSLIHVCNKLLHDQREMNQNFIKKNEEINATITSLSHDIRTPLTALDGYLQLAEQAPDIESKTHYVRLAQSRIGHMTKQMDELFLYTKLQNPEYLLELETIDASEVLKRSLFSLVDAISQTGHEPVLDLPEPAQLVIGNEHALERVFENILGNYLLHGAGRLAIGYEASEDGLKIYFSNPLKDTKSVRMDKIFTRFYKDDPSRTVHSSGLGLSIVKSLMEKMNGSANAELVGETFCISITFSKRGRA